MADWYVDFTLASNGTGTTYSGAWNVFTATEGASVSAGDSIWFRRDDPGDGNKLITIKSGDIKYVAWPKSGDVLYGSRPSSPRATWDSDLHDYTYQRRNMANGAVHAVESGNKFYRFYFYNSYVSRSQQRTIDILSKSNVSLYHCYLSTYYSGNAYNYSACLRVDSSTNVMLYKCTVDSFGLNRYFSNFRLYDSSIKFDTCYFYTPAYVSAGVGTQDSDIETSSIEDCSLVEFDHCTLYNKFTINSVSDSIYKDAIVRIHNSTVNFNDSIMKHENTSSYTSNPLIREPLALFHVDGGSHIDLNNCGYTSVATMSSFMYLADSLSAVTCSGLDVTINTNRNIIFSIESIGSLNIAGITGAINQYNNVDNANYFMAHSDRDVMFDENITISGINCYPGDILERYNTTGTDINLSNKDTYKEFKVYFGSFVNFICDNCKFGGLSFYHGDYNITQAWNGCSHTNRVISIKNTEILNNSCVSLYNTYLFDYLDLTVYKCIGDGTAPILTDTSTQLDAHVKLIRNKNFDGLGAIYVQNKEYTCLFNNRDLKVYKYNYYGHTETHSVNRTGGPGYSIKLVHSEIGSGDLVYSPIGQETIWFRLPAAGTYNITAYLLYVCDSCNLTISDIYFESDYFDSLGDSYIVNIPSLSSDTGSTWSISGNKIKLVSSVTVTDAQYCPIRFTLTTYYAGLVVYVDPKVNIELQ